MPALNLLPGDKYDGRCAEIYITEKQFLIYHCSACEEIFTTFDELLSHIIKHHYENTKELSKADMKCVETANKHKTTKENQFTAHSLFVVQTKQNDEFERKISNKDEQTVNEFFLGTSFSETIKVKNSPEKMAPILHSNKSLSQRKKLRNATGTLKSKAMGRNANALTRYQASLNDERKYVCAVCGFAFKEKYNLRNHLLRHSNSKQLSCSICSKRFFTKVELYLHEYRHKSERQHVCGRCGMGFISSVSLTQHLRKHHSLQQLFKCDQCLKLFPNLSHQHNDCKTLNSEICTECLQSVNCVNAIKKHKELRECKYNAGKEYLVETNKMSTKASNSYKCTQDDSLNERTVEGEFFVEQNLDDYELVQTLSDLECSKHV